MINIWNKVSYHISESDSMDLNVAALGKKGQEEELKVATKVIENSYFSPVSRRKTIN